MSFYKTTDKRVISAWWQLANEADALQAASKAFANQFDASPVFLSGADDFRLCGLSLKNYQQRQDAALWTAPSGTHRVSRPRRSIKKTAALACNQEKLAITKAELIKLQKKYDETWPVNSVVSREPFWNAIGTTFGEVILNGIGHFMLDGVVYLTTHIAIKNCQEILGSEYTEAASRLRKQQEAAA